MPVTPWTSENQRITPNIEIAWCWSHAVLEPYVQGASYQSCYECFHVYQTPEELVRLYNLDKPKDCPDELDVKKIYFCPLCMHDF